MPKTFESFKPRPFTPAEVVVFRGCEKSLESVQLVLGRVATLDPHDPGLPALQAFAAEQAQLVAAIRADLRRALGVRENGPPAA